MKTRTARILLVFVLVLTIYGASVNAQNSTQDRDPDLTQTLFQDPVPKFGRIVSPFDTDLSGQQTTSRSGAALLSMAASSTFSITIEAGANWLLSQQDPSGGWPWTPGGATTTNTNGPTARGMLKAYLFDSNNAYLASAVATGDFLVPTYPLTYTDGDPHIATHDPLFLEELTDVTGNPAYADFVQANFWDKLTSGTYGENNDWDAVDFGMAVVNGRAGQGIVELSPWDLSATAIAAYNAGETAICQGLMLGVIAGLEQTVAAGGYDTTGLIGAIWASSITGIDLNPGIGIYAPAQSTGDLVPLLKSMTLSASTGMPYWDGAWLWSSTADPNNISNADSQNTAYAILALEAFEGGGVQIDHGRVFLQIMQDASGQFLVWPGAAPDSMGSVEVNGEVLTALQVSTPPSPPPPPPTPTPVPPIPTPTPPVPPLPPTTITITEPMSGTELCFKDTYSVTVRAMDSGGNPVAGKTAFLYASSGELRVTSAASEPVLAICTTNIAGQCSFNWVPESLGVQHLLAQIGEIVSEKVTVNVALCGRGVVSTIYLPLMMASPDSGYPWLSGSE